MPLDQIFVFTLVIVTVAMFVWEKFSPDHVAMVALFLLFVVPFNGNPILLPKETAKTEALAERMTTARAAGDQPQVQQIAAEIRELSQKENKDQASIVGKIFGNSAILTLIFMFIVGYAVDRTGVIEQLGHWFERAAGAGGRRALVTLGLLSILVSSVLNNTTVVIVFIPMVLGMCRRSSLVPSHYLIPLSYFAIAGGMCTMIGTSTNILVDGLVKGSGLPGCGMFEFSALGLTLAFTILIFMVIFGPKLLPERACLAVLIDNESSHEVLLAAIVGQQSPLVGKTFALSPLNDMKRLRVIEVRRSGNRVETPLNELRFEAGDRVILKCHLAGVKGLSDLEALEATAKNELGLNYVHLEKAVLMEGMIGPQSELLGRSLVEINFRQQFGVLIVALHREGENQRANFERLKLEVGDTLLVEGSKERMNELFTSGDFINLSEVKAKPTAAPNAQQQLRKSRSWIAMLALAMVVVVGTIAGERVPFEWVALGAALLVVLGGCLSKEEIYHAVEWKILVMKIGMLALGVAMARTKADRTLVDALLSVVGKWDLRYVISAVLALTIIMGEMISHSAVAALLTPIVITLGQGLGMDNPRPFIAAVMMGASLGFAIPSAYQTHMLVHSAGGYKFSDFLRVGLALDFVCWAVGSVAIPIIWHLPH